MIIIYTTPSCASCRKAVKFFKENNIEFQEKNIFNEKLTREELKTMIANCENGFDDIISFRSKIIQELEFDILDLKVSELEEFIIKNPSILRRPIMIDRRKFQVGYNEEEIRSFIPRSLRDLSTKACEKCDKTCDYVAELDKTEIK